MTPVRQTGHLRDRYTLLARTLLRTAGLKRKFKSGFDGVPVDNIIVIGVLRGMPSEPFSKRSRPVSPERTDYRSNGCSSFSE